MRTRACFIPAPWTKTMQKVLRLHLILLLLFGVVVVVLVLGSGYRCHASSIHPRFVRVPATVVRVFCT